MSGKKVQSAYCGHTMLTARSHTGVEFPAAPRLAFFCPALVVTVGSHRHTTFQLLVFKVRETIATGGKHRLWTFDNFPPRFPFWDRLCLRRQPQVVEKAKSAQLQPMGRPRGLNDPSLKHAAGLDTTWLDVCTLLLWPKRRVNGAGWDPFGEHYPLSRITLKFAQKLGSKVANNSSSQVQV